MPALAVEPAHPNQSDRRPVEIVESGRASSAGITLSVPGACEPQDVAFLVEMPDHLDQSFSRTENTVEIKAPIIRWTSALEQKFARYAARLAAGIATEEEVKTLTDLQNTRDRLYLARSGADVLRDFEERQRTAALVQALRRYVEFTAH